MTHYIDPLQVALLGFAVWLFVWAVVIWFAWDLFLYGFRATGWFSTSWDWWTHRRYRLKAVGRSYVMQYRRRCWPFWIDLDQTPYF